MCCVCVFFENEKTTSQLFTAENNYSFEHGYLIADYVVVLSIYKSNYTN